MSDDSLLAALAQRLEAALAGETVEPLPLEAAGTAAGREAVSAANRVLEVLAPRAPVSPAPPAESNGLSEVLDIGSLGAHEYVLEADDRLIFQGGNAVADGILGIDHSTLVGKPLEEAFPGLRETCVPELYTDIGRGAQARHLALIPYDHDGISGVFDVVACNTGPARVTAFFRDASADRAVATALQHSRARLQSTLQAAPVAVAVCRGGVLQDVNPYLCELTGHRADDLRGAPCAELYVSGEEFERVYCSAHQQLRTKPVATAETRWRCRDGSVLDVVVSFAYGAEVEGELEITFAALDVTAGKRMLQALRASEERYRALVEASPDGVAMLTPGGIVLTVNARFAEMLAVDDVSRLLGSASTLLVAPQESARLREAHARITQERRPQRLETVLQRRDGGELEVELALAGVWDEAGSLVAIIATGRDIAERKAAEEALRASEQRFREMADLLPEVVFEADCEGRVRFANRQAFATLGYRPVELALAPAVLDFIVEAERPIAAERLQRRLQGEQLAPREYTMLRNDGSTFPGRLQMAPSVRDGRVVGVRGVVIDVTEHRQLTEELAASRRTAWTLLNAVPGAALLLRPDGTVIAGNDAGAGALGVHRTELPGIAAITRLPEALRSECLQRLARVAETGAADRFELETAGRTYFVSIHPLASADGQVARLAAFVQEITDQRRAEQSQRLATVGELAAGVAHEFNNLLCAIWMNADLANARRSPDTYSAAYQSIREAARRGSSICDNLLSFARPATPVRAVMPAEAPLEFALSLARPQLSTAGIAVERDFSRGLTVCVDRSQFEQLYLNLIINACHAMPEGGRLRLSTVRDDGSSRWPIVVRISDDGCGIPPENVSRIFDPFFTTKSAEGGNSGTGLGLAVSQTIVAAHEGDIRVTSVPGRGTCFSVHLPASADDAGPGLQGQEEDSARQGGRLAGLRVLIAEDEEAIREAASEFLNASGLQTMTAASAADALALLAQSTYDVVVTDLMMPGGGLSILRALAGQPRRPGIIVVTGKLGAGLEGDLRSAGADLVLGKPFGPMELLEAIGRLSGA